MANISEYSSKSTATRGFYRASGNRGDASKYVHKLPYDKWGFDADLIPQAIAEQVAEEEAENQKLIDDGLVVVDEGSPHVLHAIPGAHPEVDAMEADAEHATPRVLAGVAFSRKSEVTGAVQACHAFYAANPDLRRKDAIAGAVAKGIAFYTARTQYQKWFAAKKVVRLQ